MWDAAKLVKIKCGMKNFIRKTLKRFLPNSLYNRFSAYLWLLPRAILAAWYYGFPARELKIIGVAGTKGKSTTCYLISQLLDVLGEKNALLSTTTIKIGAEEKLSDLKMTSADSFYLQRFLRQAVSQGCTYAVLEISSHALKQFRTFGIQLDYAVLTNLAPDHLEYHKNAQDYQDTHFKMLSKKTAALLLNGDDENLNRFKRSKISKMTFGFNTGNDLVIRGVEMEKGNSRAVITYQGKELILDIPLAGKFNVYNSVAALAVALKIGKEIGKISKALAKVRPAPGRVEKLENKLGIEIIVDYAHSPESFENVFSAIAPYLSGRLIAVTGACGERDASKRPIMGSILASYCDYVVITNDDPFGEDPEKIASALIAGLQRTGKQEGKNFCKILDRRSAIKKGLSLAHAGDTVIILGKGSEQWQVFKDKKIPWDDRRITREILNEIS